MQWNRLLSVTARQRLGKASGTQCRCGFRTSLSTKANNGTSKRSMSKTALMDISEQHMREISVLGSRTGKPSNILPLSIVTSPSVKLVLPLVGNAAYIVVASGFLMTDMLQLRVALVAGYTGLVAFHALHPRPLRIPLAWSALFILVNTTAACLLVMDRYAPPTLSENDEILYQEHFSNALTRGQFYQLMQMASRHDNLPDGAVLTVEGQICPRVYFLEVGSAKIYHNNLLTASIEQGGFVNDVAFSQGQHVGAYGTVVASGEGCSVITWEQTELQNHLRNRPEMERNMKFLMSEHLVKSLLRQRDGAHKRAEGQKSRSWWTPMPSLPAARDEGRQQHSTEF